MNEYVFGITVKNVLSIPGRQIMSTNSSLYQRLYMKMYRRKRRNRIIQTLGGRCVKCFSIHNLEVHHTIPVFRNINDRQIDSFGDLMNTWNTGKGGLLIKCAKCHKELNGNGLSLIEKSLPVRTDRLLGAFK